MQVINVIVNSTWLVDLFVYGPIAIQRRINLNEPKGFRLENPFYSDIEMDKSQFGVRATITAFASSSHLAQKAALLFFGQMLDVLAYHIDSPLLLSLTERTGRLSDNPVARRIIDEDTWRSCFREARLLALSEPSFMRALGWYHKGLITENPLDKFLAYWNSIEIVASKYHPPIPQGRSTGSKSTIWESFKLIWGECEYWPIILGDKQWIDANYDLRVSIAHGTGPVDINQVEIVLGKLETIGKVAHAFLTKWRGEQLNPKLPPELLNKFGYG
jgi:hypothetical protein